MALAGLIAAGRMGTAINISNRPFELLQPLRKRGLTGGQVVDCGEELISRQRDSHRDTFNDMNEVSRGVIRRQ